MIEFIDLGLINYNEALLKQEELLKKKQDGDETDYIIFCSHPEVVTLGRSTKFTINEIKDWKGEVIETSRGGRATYHGPSQLVIYPIIDLKKNRSNLPAKDIHAYLRVLEEIIIDVLNLFGIPSKQEVKPEGSSLEMTGVWVDGKKMAAIGIAVKKWISMHGIALNVQNDPKAFAGISPCGFTGDIVTSMEKVLSQKIDKNILKNEFKNKFACYLSNLE